MKAQAERAVDDGGICPVVQRSVSYSQVIGTPQKEAGKLPLLLGRQLRWPPRHTAARHRTVRTPEAAGHLRDRCARLQQLSPAPSQSLQLLGASRWSHASESIVRGIKCLLFTHTSINIMLTQVRLKCPYQLSNVDHVTRKYADTA